MKKYIPYKHKMVKETSTKTFLVIPSSPDVIFCYTTISFNFTVAHAPTTWLPRVEHNTRSTYLGGAVSSWLVHSTPERAVRVPLAGDIVLCSWARHLTPTLPLSTQAPVVRKPINVNPRLNRPNPRSKFILRLNSVPQRPISTIQG